MEEKIYTIPLNDTFSEVDGCPLCRLRRWLESREIELILGASMMEPDVRIQTNKLGFCEHHFTQLLAGGHRLSFALILESHVNEIRNGLFSSRIPFVKPSAEKQAAFVDKLGTSCYICSRIDANFDRMLENLAFLWNRESEFRQKFAAQKMFCLPHYSALLKSAKLIDKKRSSEFTAEVERIEKEYLEELSSDVSWFCKKFDYRYNDEPWGNAKDAVERTLRTLTAGQVPPEENSGKQK